MENSNIYLKIVQEAGKLHYLQTIAGNHRLYLNTHKGAQAPHRDSMLTHGPHLVITYR